jgi:hypothetical protein
VSDPEQQIDRAGARWGIHNCARDPQCRADDPHPPNRLYLHTPWGSFILALDWSARTQLWLPFRGYTDWWAPLVWHPRATR